LFKLGRVCSEAMTVQSMQSTGELHSTGASPRSHSSNSKMRKSGNMRKTGDMNRTGDLRRTGGRDHSPNSSVDEYGDHTTSKASFNTLLKRRFGSVTAAWRLVLDEDGKGKISFTDFCRVTRDMGYTKNVKGLWAELDDDGSGFISLNELDEKAAQSLDDFIDFITDKFGNTLRAWKYFDADKNNRLDIQEFQDQCKKIGYEGDARYIYSCLKTDCSKNFITLRDLDPEAHIAQMRGDLNMLARKMQHKFVYSSSLPDIHAHARPDTKGGRKSTVNSRWTQDRAGETIRMARQAKKSHQSADQGMRSLDEFKKLLVNRFGNLFAAWRQGLDLHGNGHISFGELCLAMRELGFNGNVKAAWTALDTDGDGFIRLSDLDPVTEQMINSYTALVKENFGNMLNAWLETLCKDGHGCVDKGTFQKHCRRIGWQGNVDLLYESLKNDRGRNFMTLRDYDVAAAQSFFRGDFEMITAQTTSPHFDSFKERNENCFRQRWARMQSKAMLEERDRSTQEERRADKAVDDVVSMKELLGKKYGTMTAAWRHGFEGNENGRVSFVQFCDAMRRLGYAGNIKECFTRLDAAEKGHLTLQDLDAEAFEMVTEFRKILLDKYGNYIEAWKALDDNRNNQLEEDELINVCQIIGYTRNPKKLFRFLLDHPGKRFISLGDLDPAAMRAYYRGDLAAMSPQERGKAVLEKRVAEEKKEKEKLMAAGDLKSLKSVLLRKFGSVTAAWRYGLDVENTGRLSFVDFSKGCREVGFVGNIKRVFQEMDDDDSGIITFNELDPKWFARLCKFQELLLAKYKTYESAWRIIDSDKSNFIDMAEFVEVCKNIGYPGSVKEQEALFKQLLPPFAKHMAKQDLQIGGTIVQAVTGLHIVMEDDQLVSKVEQAKNELVKRATLVLENRRKSMAAGDLDGLMKELLKKYGTITAAWRYGLDPAGNGRVSFVDFTKACREIGFMGNIKQIFQEIDDDDSGIITFNEIDPVWFTRLHFFQEKLLAKYVSYDSAWKAIDSDRSNKVECDEFVDICRNIEYPGPPEEAAQLFRQLCKDPGQKALAREDFLVGGVVVKAVTGMELVLNDDDLLTKDEKGKIDLDRRTRVHAEHKSKELGAKDWKSLKKVLINKFGSITAAWRNHLDRTSVGKVAFGTFVQACRDVAFAGDIKATFKELDQDGSGVITFSEVDAKICQRHSRFHSLLLNRYGTYDDAWAAIDANGNKALEESEFLAVCEDIGFTGDATALFKQHLSHQGNRNVNEDDMRVVGMIVRSAALSMGSKSPAASRQNTKDEGPEMGLPTEHISAESNQPAETNQPAEVPAVPAEASQPAESNQATEDAKLAEVAPAAEDAKPADDNAAVAESNEA